VHKVTQQQIETVAKLIAAEIKKETSQLSKGQQKLMKIL
jgi:hypothetical protein